jgi:glycosyltransferase involved in cell wall biosynthesis
MANGLAPLHLRDHQQALSIHNVSANADDENGDRKISIIMPAFNSAGTIESAARGILDQSWRNLELIIVDDCSTDNTWEIIETIAAADSRVIPIRQPLNGGAYKSRNAGLAAATGEYITVNDADDWSHPQRIAVQMKALLDNPDVLNATYGIRATEDLIGVIKPRSGNSIIVNTASLIIPRALVQRLGFWDEVRFSSDSELYFRLRQELKIKEENLFRFVPLSFILSREDSLTNSGPTGLGSLHYGARREYKEASAYWRSISADLRIEPGKRAFPVPRIALERTVEPIVLDILIVSDFSADNPDNLQLVEKALAVGRRVGLFHLPRVENFGADVHLSIRKLIHEHAIPVIVIGENVACKTVLAVDPVCLMALPDSLPGIEADRCVVLNSTTAQYDPETVTTNAAALCRTVINAHTFDLVLGLVEQPDQSLPARAHVGSSAAKEMMKETACTGAIASRRHYAEAVETVALLATEIRLLEARRADRRLKRQR